ncbi:hypothetical protein G9A89_000223 [Geosiphon pyriformis]|nr:hypothetical protein G9A89_000223 [Geosiphon pyriformis]
MMGDQAPTIDWYFVKRYLVPGDSLRVVLKLGYLSYWYLLEIALCMEDLYLSRRMDRRYGWGTLLGTGAHHKVGDP